MMQTVSFPNNAKSSTSYLPYLKELRGWLHQMQKDIDSDLARLGFSRKSTSKQLFATKADGNGLLAFFQPKGNKSSQKLAPAQDADTGQQSAGQFSAARHSNVTTNTNANDSIQAGGGSGTMGNAGASGNGGGGAIHGNFTPAFESLPGLMAEGWWNGMGIMFTLTSGQELRKKVSSVGVETYLETNDEAPFVPHNINAILLKEEGLLQGHLARVGTSRHWLFAPNTPQLNMIAETICAQRRLI